MRRSLSHLNQVAARSAGVKEIVTAGELASYLGITERRIQQLAKEGLPRAGRGAYNFRDSIRFYVGYLQRLIDENNSNTIVAEKIRMMRAKATRAEIDAEKAGGGVLDLETARQEVMHLAGQIKETFLSLPGRMAPELAGLDAGNIKSRLSDAVVAALNQVSDRIEKYAAERGCQDSQDREVPACGAMGGQE